MKQHNPLWSVAAFAGRCKGKLTLSVLCAILSVAGGMVPYWGAYKIIQLFFSGSPTLEGVLFYGAVSATGYLLKVVFYGISTTLSHICAYTILEQIRHRIAAKLMKAPLGSVLSDTAGRIKNAVVDRVETIELPLAHVIPEGISNILLVVAVVVYLFMIDWRMALAAMVSIPLAAVVYAVMMRDYVPRYDAFMRASNHVNSVMVEYVEGIEVIKAFGRAGAAYEKFQSAVTSFRDYTLDWFQSTWKLMNLGGAILPSTLLGTLPIGLVLYMNGSLTAADLTMCLMLPMGIIAPLTTFTVFVNDMKAIEYAMRDAGGYLNMEELPDHGAKPMLMDHDIRLNHVSFAYDPAGQNAIRDVSLRIPQGRFTAIVGPSGSGKTTLARLIARFWDVADGSILIGGVDIRDMAPDHLATIVSFVTQDNFLFDCSLMENIRLGNPKASDQQVFEAAKAACCDEFIHQLPDGYQTQAGVAGTRLSGGEKQRVAIARAILKDAPVVILDEATAFADPENEDKIQRSIAALARGKTLVVIAHRLSTIKNADQIVVLREGKIVASGKHESLLKACDLYDEMWKAHIGAKQWAAKGGEANG